MERRKRVPPTKLVRILVAIVLVIAAILTKAKYPHVWNVIGNWSRHARGAVVHGVGIASAILLAIAIALLMWDRFIRLPKKHSYDAQLGRALTSGLLIFVILVALVLALGALFRSAGVVMVIGLFTITISAWLIGGLIVEGIKARRAKQSVRAATSDQD